MKDRLLNLYKSTQAFIAKYEIYILAIIAILALALSFPLALKRYNNFGFGKFDLGNMSQVVWNTSRGDIYQVTDQFGTNMSRLGMSHFDPILILFAPIYWIYANPMLLVFLQHVAILSAVFPIYFLSKKLLKNSILSLMITLSFLLYPALGYTLVWTEFHGISFVAPFLIWVVWLLEKNDFNFGLNRTSIIIYSTLMLLMLMGKEEIGAILALFSLIVMSKNFKLGLISLIVSTMWFGVVFFWLIPAYSDVRRESIDRYLSYIGEANPITEDAQGDNFFYKRYSYLGDDYLEMTKNLFLKRSEVKEQVLTSAKRETFIYLFGPFAFVPLLNVYTYISIPDYLITILSEDEIFSISNHRVSFIIFTTILGYIYFLSFVANRFKKIRYLVHLVIFSSLFLGIYFSIITKNPLLMPIFSKLPFSSQINQALASRKNPFSSTGEGYIKNKTVDNTLECKTAVTDFVLGQGNASYTGPDYLGAHTANRTTNAIFPSAGWDAQVIVADIYEYKTYEPLENVVSWTVNKQTLHKMLTERVIKHTMSCDRMMVFTEGVNKDNVEFIESGAPTDLTPLIVKDHGIAVKLRNKEITNDSIMVEYDLQRLPETELMDKVTYWYFIDENEKELEFIDYVPIALTERFDEAKDDSYLKIKRDLSFIRDHLNGKVKVYYGFTNQIEGGAVYLEDWQL